MKTETHQITIGNHSYFVRGSNTEELKRISKIMGFEFDNIRPTPLSTSQNIIKVWGIGELKDYVELEMEDNSY